MLFDKRFKVVEILESGITISHYLKGSRKKVNADIEMFKKKAKNYEMMGKSGMIVWV
jgi:hypothetical protein